MKIDSFINYFNHTMYHMFYITANSKCTQILG